MALPIIKPIANLTISGAVPPTYNSIYFGGLLTQLQVFSNQVVQNVNRLLAFQMPWTGTDPTNTAQITPDFKQAAIFVINPTAAFFVANPTNQLGINGYPSGTFIITQPVSPFVVSFDSNYVFSVPLPSPSGGESIVIPYQVVSANKIILNPGNYS